MIQYAFIRTVIGKRNDNGVVWNVVSRHLSLRATSSANIAMRTSRIVRPLASCVLSVISTCELLYSGQWFGENYSIVAIEPFRMMIDLLCTKRHSRHEGEGLVEVFESVLLCNSISSVRDRPTVRH